MRDSEAGAFDEFNSLGDSAWSHVNEVKNNRVRHVIACPIASSIP